MKYTDEQRQQALDLYVDVGSAEASRRLDIPARTIRHWATQADLAQARGQKTEAARAMLAIRHAEMREELRARLLEKALDALDRMDQIHYDYKGKDAKKVEYEVAPSGAFKDYATGAAILIDKYRLEMGETTSRVHHEGTDDIDRSVRNLVAELERRSQTTAT